MLDGIHHGLDLEHLVEKYVELVGSHVDVAFGLGRSQRDGGSLARPVDALRLRNGEGIVREFRAELKLGVAVRPEDRLEGHG